MVSATSSQEAMIVQHIDIFERNGFHLEIDEDAPSGKRVKLVSIPFSKSIHFGPDDVCELASILSDGYGESYFDSKETKKYLVVNNDSLVPDIQCNANRPKVHILPKLMAMFASRACRSAVMIGTALNTHEMRNIVTQLESIDQPWNCPHGRPTMRHLVDLKKFSM